MSQSQIYLGEIARSTKQIGRLVEMVVHEYYEDRNKRHVVLEAISKTISAGFGDSNVGALPGAQLEVWIDPLHINRAFIDIYYKGHMIETASLHTKSITATEIGGAMTEWCKENTDIIREYISWIDQLERAIRSNTI